MEFAGGQCDAGEPPWLTHREVLEEVALNVRVRGVRGVYSVPGRDHLVLTFLCEPSTTVTLAADEIDKVGGFARGELPVNMREHHEGHAFGEPTLVMRVDG